MYKAPPINISGLVSVVPDNSISIDEEYEKYSWNESQLKKIKANIGINKRRLVDSNTTTFDLMKKAGQKLLNEMEIDPQSIDALIVVTQTPDFLQPGNSFILQDQLNLRKSIISLDITNGCSGFVYGLSLASSLLNNYKMSKVLLFCGDTISKLVNENDQAVAPLFGDAAAACLIENQDNNNGCDFFSFGSNGKGFDSLIVKNGGFRNFQNKNMFLEMNGNKVMLFSITEEPKDIDNILKFSKINKESVDFVVLHQANTYILKNIAQRINFPLDKIPHSSFGVYGNTSSASIPLAISHELNSKIVNRKKRFIFSGFGVGLCWSTIINDSTLTFCPQPTIY